MHVYYLFIHCDTLFTTCILMFDESPAIVTALLLLHIWFDLFMYVYYLLIVIHLSLLAHWWLMSHQEL